MQWKFASGVKCNGKLQGETAVQGGRVRARPGGVSATNSEAHSDGDRREESKAPAAAKE